MPIFLECSATIVIYLRITFIRKYPHKYTHLKTTLVQFLQKVSNYPKCNVINYEDDPKKKLWITIFFLTMCFLLNYRLMK